MKIVEKPDTYPKIQTVIVAVAGVVSWKALDVYETLNQEGMSE